MRELGKKKSKLHVQEAMTTKDASGTEIRSTGTRSRFTYRTFRQQMSKIEEVYVWVWYPWRAHPEHPVPALPCPRTLKNLHGAVVTSLSPRQKQNRENMLSGVTLQATDEALSSKFSQKHPFLSYICEKLRDKPKGFPFWYKKYPSTRHAYENRFAVPKEMLDGYDNAEMRRAFSFPNMRNGEKLRAETTAMCERYCPDDTSRRSIPARCIRLAIFVREKRNHLLTNPKNHIGKRQLGNLERALQNAMRRWRKEDFRGYWEFVREHDMLDIIQPENRVKYRWGMWWRSDWRFGHALSSSTTDFLDPRGLMGCVETGRSCAEVARDLALSYTRTLNTKERKYFESRATYFERLQQFKYDHVEANRERERQEYLNKLQALYQRRSARNLTVDIPRKLHRTKNISLQRWKCWRHGPM